MINSCERCGKVYKRPPALIGRFCSKKCLYISRRGIKRPKKERDNISIGLKKAYKEKRRFHISWKGGRTESRGYVYIWSPNHPFTTKHGYIPEHRLVMEKHIGRYIISNKEVVHHINGIPNDNKIENLILLTWGEHTKLHRNGKKHTKEQRNNISKGMKLAYKLGKR